ncbi:helix-turn-helix transcriptional regulator, partial [Enterococcus faecalis]|uniref:helix-turn-helix transcriptional regulator n=1 Tax=Enterococcus faecalis TaxID=1351 RepID=UPI00403F5DB0
GYVAKDERSSQRHVEPTAVVHSGYRWYLVAFDLDRDDWRTFRIDRLRGRVRPSGKGRPRTVPSGDPAAFVQQRLRSSAEESDRAPGRVRVRA